MGKILIGTSGWNYFHWKGRFYPENLKGYEMLKFYSKEFSTVEVNSSFYHLPKKQTIKKWYEYVKKDFVFSLKMPRAITHFKRLKIEDEKSEKILFYFFENIKELKKKLGAVLIQLPPSFKKDLKILEKFLKKIKKICENLKSEPELAIEFRNRSWFGKDVLKILKNYNITFVISHSSRFPMEKFITTNIVYIRFHGPKKLFASKYSEKELKEWAEFVKNLAKNIKKVYVYFNNDFEGFAVENAKFLQKILKAR